MRALVLADRARGPALVDQPIPEPGPGELRLRVAGCGLNFADLLMISGRYQERPALPFTLGIEVAGTVDALGPGLDGPAPGTRVAALPGTGGLAEHCVCPAERCIALPDAMPFEHAAAFLVAYGTAHLALAHKARLRAGERVLVLGAAGGVGLAAVELGRRMGAEVIAVARGAARQAAARAAGAHHCLDSDTADLREACRALGGVDVVFDAVGEPLATPALRALRPEGRFLCIGFAGGAVPQFPGNLLLVKNLSVLGLYWGGYLRFAPDVLTGSLSHLFDWYAQGGLRPHVSHRLPLERAAEGLELLRTRSATGKVVIEPGAAR